MSVPESTSCRQKVLKIHAFPQQCVAELAAMKQHLRVVQAGVSVGEVKGKDLIPAHALAMSALLLRQDVFATEAVSYEQAIAYLRKEGCHFAGDSPSRVCFAHLSQYSSGFCEEYRQPGLIIFIRRNGVSVAGICRKRSACCKGRIRSTTYFCKSVPLLSDIGFRVADSSGGSGR